MDMKTTSEVDSMEAHDSAGWWNATTTSKVASTEVRASFFSEIPRRFVCCALLTSISHARLVFCQVGRDPVSDTSASGTVWNVLHSGGGLVAVTVQHALLSLMIPQLSQLGSSLGSATGVSGGSWSLELRRRAGHYMSAEEMRTVSPWICFI